MTDSPCCDHSVKWHHDTRGCGYHGHGPDRCPCLLTFDEALAQVQAEAKARALIDFADSTRFPSHWILFRRDDGSGVTVSDMLRETAANYRKEVSDG